MDRILKPCYYSQSLRRKTPNSNLLNSDFLKTDPMSYPPRAEGFGI